MEWQGIVPEPPKPQGLAPAEGSCWEEPPAPLLNVEEETEMQE